MVRKYKGLRRGASGRLLCPRYVMRTDSDEDSNEEQMHETQIDSQVERNEEAGKNVEGNEKERVSEKAGKDGEERGLDEAATVRKGNEEGVADEPNGDEENEETEKQDGEEENEKEAEESNEENIPLEPLGMYFKRSEFRKTIKIQSRCYIREAVHDINELLDENEKQWFHEHPQFKHFFHMHLEKKHKVQGM